MTHSAPRIAVALWAGALLLAGLPTPGRADASSLFAPYLRDIPPQVVEVIDRKQENSIEITHLRFLNRTLPNGGKVIIYGILARPTGGKGRYPAILVCHGGGASASRVEPAVKSWAGLGYVAFCQDEPGIAGSEMQSTGPWDRKWKDSRTEQYWHCLPDPTAPMLYDGIAAALNGLSLLRSQPDVDPSRVGVTGGSWGGYLTDLVSGLAGSRIKTAFAVYGSGFYEQATVFAGELNKLSREERAAWIENYDAGGPVRQITASYFLAIGACDWFFWPPAVEATFDQIRSPKNIAFSPNTSHVLGYPGGNLRPPMNQREHRAREEIDWMNYQLKGQGDPFPACLVESPPLRDGNAIDVTFRVAGTHPIAEKSVWYSYGETPWRTRFWKKLPCQQTGAGEYRAVLPVEEPDCPLDWFALVTDERQISVSTPMQRVFPTDCGFKLADRRALPWKAAADLSWLGSSFHPPHEEGVAYSDGEFRLVPRLHDDQTGVEVTDRYALDCFGLRGVSLARDRTAGLSFWVRSAARTGYSVQIVNEINPPDYQVWESLQKDPGATWKRVQIAWSDFHPLDPSNQTPMLGKSTAKFRIVTPEGADLMFSDFSADSPPPAPR